MEFIFVLTVMFVIAAPAAWLSDRIPDHVVDAIAGRFW
jgi:hypothetical protein